MHHQRVLDVQSSSSTADRQNTAGSAHCRKHDIVAWDLSAEAWTTWIVFMGHGYAYFSPIITNHLDHFHLYFPLRIPFSGLPEIEIDL